MTPDDLVDIVSAQKLKDYAQKHGIRTATDNPKDIAYAIYESATNIPTVRDIVNEYVTDPNIVDQLISEIYAEIEQGEIDDVVRELVEVENVPVDTAQHAAEASVERDVAKRVIKKAKKKLRISEPDSEAIIDDINKIDDGLKAFSQKSPPPPSPKPRRPPSPPPRVQPQPKPRRPPSPVIRRQPSPTPPPMSPSQQLPAHMQLPVLKPESTEKIESLIQDLMDPRARVSELANVQKRVYELLGLVN